MTSIKTQFQNPQTPIHSDLSVSLLTSTVLSTAAAAAIAVLIKQQYDR